MAKPPSGYKGPLGYPCGKSWAEPLIVTGELPGKNFGKHLTHTLSPVVTGLGDKEGEIGWGGTYEDTRKSQLFDRLEDVLSQLRIAGLRMTQAEKDSVEWLINRAAEELDAVRDIHVSWNFRVDGTYPLSYGDSIKDFPAAKHWQDCANPDNILTPPGPHYGFEVPAEGGGTVRCPSRTTLNLRPVARKMILQHFIDAAMHIRCAEFGIWRITLYRQAREEWLKTARGGAPGGLRTPPREGRGGAGGFAAPTYEPPTGGDDDWRIPPDAPPETPVDVKLPPPPTGSATDDENGSGTTPRKKRKSSSGKAIALGLGLAGIGYLALKK